METEPMRIIHSGTELSFEVTTGISKEELILSLNNGEKKTIRVESVSPIALFCPSIEGTVIWCKFESGEERVYDVLTGEHINDAYMEKVKSGEREMPRINFYD